MSKVNANVKAVLLSDVEALAVVLADVGGEKSVVQKMGLNFSLAVKKSQEILKEREKTRLAELEAEKARQEAIKEERRVEAENMLKYLVENAGIKLEVAKEMVRDGMAAKYAEPKKLRGKRATTFKFNRVEINYNGEVYTMPTTGNMPEIWKERVSSEFGQDRAGFITKYAVDAEQAAEVLALKNGANA